MDKPCDGVKYSLERPFKNRMPDLGKSTAAVLASLGGELFHESPGEAVAVVDDCLFAVRLRHMSLPTVLAIEKAFESLRGRYDRVNYFGVSKVGQQPPTDAVRDEMARVVGVHTKAIIAAAIVCEGDGFLATVARSVITAVHMASRASHPLRVFEANEPALRWLESRQPSRSTIDRTRLTRAAEVLCASAA